MAPGDKSQAAVHMHSRGEGSKDSIREFQGTFFPRGTFGSSDSQRCASGFTAAEKEGTPKSVFFSAVDYLIDLVVK